MTGRLSTGPVELPRGAMPPQLTIRGFVQAGAVTCHGTPPRPVVVSVRSRRGDESVRVAGVSAIKAEQGVEVDRSLCLVFHDLPWETRTDGRSSTMCTGPSRSSLEKPPKRHQGARQELGERLHVVQSRSDPGAPDSPMLAVSQDYSAALEELDPVVPVAKGQILGDGTESIFSSRNCSARRYALLSAIPPYFW